MHQSDPPEFAPDRSKPIIVVGNEKGGSGKSTTAMHLMVWFMSTGLTVGSLDLDLRQRTLTRYLENRTRFTGQKRLDLAMPRHRVLAPAASEHTGDAQAEEQGRFFDALSTLTAECDIIVVDCPGSDSHLSRLAHACADTIITPVNDSFVDVDLLARVDPESHAVQGPSLYAEMVWEARKQRAMENRTSIDWVVLRNRVSSLNARNKRRVEGVLQELAGRIGFRYVSGFGERVIFRELFLSGLTLMDLGDSAISQMAGGLTMSHLAARQELRRLAASLNLPAGHGYGQEEGAANPEKNLHAEAADAIS